MNKTIYVTYSEETYPEFLNPVRKEYELINPEWKLEYFSNNDRLKFVEDNFPEFLESYSNIIPISFQTDFWRFMVLYKYGGLYLDIKIRIAIDLNKIISNDTEFLTFFNLNDLHTGFMYSKKNNLLFYNLCERINLNVKNRIYFEGINRPDLYLTGPRLLAYGYKSHYNFNTRSLFFTKDEINNLGRFTWDNENCIFYYRKMFIGGYNHKKWDFLKKESYVELYKKRIVYRDGVIKQIVKVEPDKYPKECIELYDKHKIGIEVR